MADQDPFLSVIQAEMKSSAEPATPPGEGQPPVQVAAPAAEPKSEPATVAAEPPKVETPVIPAEPEPSQFKAFMESKGFKSEQDALKYISEVEGRKPEITNPLLKSAFEFVEKGGDLDSWYASQRTDFDKLATEKPLEVLLTHAKLNNTANVPVEDLQFELEQRFKTDPEANPELTDTEIRANKIALTREVAKALTDLKAWQVKEQTPQAVRNEQEMAEAFQRNTLASRESALKINELKVGDYAHKLDWESEALKPVKQATDDPAGWVEKNIFLPENKGLNVARITELLLKEAQFESAAKSYADVEKAKEIAAVKKAVVNPGQSPRHETPAPGTEEEWQKVKALF